MSDKDVFKSKLLIIDDRIDNIDLIIDMLEDEGYDNIEYTLNAKKAYDKLYEKKYDLVILDYMMPDIDGIEACRYIKANFHNLPVIIATAKTDQETLKNCFEAGANDYVRKPIVNEIELLARVKNALLTKFHNDYIESLNKDLDLKIKKAIEENTKHLKIIQEQNKLAALGEMIGAIAHQWRQPLNVINTNIQNLEYDFLEGKLSNENYIKEFIEKNKKIIKFMSNTIDDFRNFFRIDKTKQIFSIRNSIESVYNILNAQLKNYNIDFELIENDFELNGYKSEFEQVILNLINNAKDALLENNIDNPKITIDIEPNTKTISILDNAGGIDENIIDRIFEPYFTTKEQGKGTGMGLYMSKMIIENNMGGKIWVENSDNGAKFYICFKGEKCQRKI